MAAPDECWIWIGAISNAGYGQTHVFIAPGIYQKGLAHRFSWEITNGAIPPQEEVCHRCDTPACVNPRHLFLGSHFGNMDDCFRKGRFAARERHPAAKLNWDAVEDIRANRGLFTQKELGQKHGVHQSVISDVQNNRIWRIDGERSPKTRN